MCAESRSSRALQQSFLSPASACPPCDRAAYSSGETAGSAGRSSSAQQIEKTSSGLPPVLRVSKNTRFAPDGLSGENNSHPSVFVSSNIYKSRQHLEGEQRHRHQRKEKDGERKHKSQHSQPKTSATLLMEATMRYCVFPQYLRWVIYMFALFAFVLVAFQRFMHDNFKYESSIFQKQSHHIFSPDIYILLTPVVSLLPTHLPLSSVSSLWGDSSSFSNPAGCSAVNAAGACTSTATGGDFVVNRETSSSPQQTIEQRAAAPEAVDSDGSTAQHAREATATPPEKGKRTAATDEEGSAAAAATEETVFVKESVRSLSDINPSDIDLYSYKRAEVLTLVHDAAAEGPAAAPAGRRVAVRPPPFTQGLIASPLQLPVWPRSGAASTEAPQATTNQKHSAGVSPAERCLERFGWSPVLLETSGLYSQSYIREFYFCTGETVRQLYLHPALFAEGAAYLWEPHHQHLLLLILTWRERLMLVLHAETWDFLGTLTVDFEGWGLASNLSIVDAVTALGLVKKRRTAVDTSDAVAATAFGIVEGDMNTGADDLAAGEAADNAAAQAREAGTAKEIKASSDGSRQGRRSLLRPQKKRKKVEEAVLPLPLYQRLNQQRLWATTGSDVLLELDVPQVLDSVRLLPRYAAATTAAEKAPAFTKTRSTSTDDVLPSSGVVNEEKSSDSRAASASDTRARASEIASTPETTKDERGSEAAAAQQTVTIQESNTTPAAAARQAATTGPDVAAVGLEPTAVVSNERADGVQWVSWTPFNVEAVGGGGAVGDMEDVFAAVASSDVVRVKRRIPLRCLGASLTMLNELEYVHERQSLIGNVFGAYVLVEVRVDSGYCKSLGSFGGLEGALRSADKFDRVMNGIALLPPLSVFSSALLSDSSDAAAHSIDAAAESMGNGNAAHQETPGKEVAADSQQLERGDALDADFSLTAALANSARAVFPPFTVLYSMLLNALSSSQSADSAVESSIATSTQSNILLTDAAISKSTSAASDGSGSAISATKSAASDAGTAFPSALVLTGKQWKELHVVETIQLHNHRSRGRGNAGPLPRIDNYSAVEAAYPGFFSRRGLRSLRQYEA